MQTLTGSGLNRPARKRGSRFLSLFALVRLCRRDVRKGSAFPISTVMTTKTGEPIQVRNIFACNRIDNLQACF
jgi:hypothetical protein